MNERLHILAEGLQSIRDSIMSEFRDLLAELDPQRAPASEASVEGKPTGHIQAEALASSTTVEAAIAPQPVPTDVPLVAVTPSPTLELPEPSSGSSVTSDPISDTTDDVSTLAVRVATAPSHVATTIKLPSLSGDVSLPEMSLFAFAGSQPVSAIMHPSALPAEPPPPPTYPLYGPFPLYVPISIFRDFPVRISGVFEQECLLEYGAGLHTNAHLSFANNVVAHRSTSLIAI